MNDFPHHAFREYDIRGIAGTDITEPLAYRLGVAYAGMLKAAGFDSTQPLIVARDVRLSGPAIQAAVIQGLRDAGHDVLDIGMAPTPLAYYSVYHFEAAGCVMVTASHNPGEYNGFKLMRGRESLHGEDIGTLARHMQELYCDPAHPFAGERKGKLTQTDIIPVYHEQLLRDIHLERPLRVVVDAGNGPSGVVAAPLYRDLGCEVIELFCEPDGNFPNHHPDPTEEKNLVDVANAVRENGADIGIAFDGDGDRIGVVDEHGKVIWGDMLLLLLSRELLKVHPGATIISEVKCSQHMYDDIRKHGGNGIMWRTGHSPIKAKMKETGAKLAGEMSGHMFFADRYFGFDDATYAGARILEMLSNHDAPLSGLLDDVPQAVTTPELRVDCPDEVKFDLVQGAKAHFSAKGYDIIDVDGMRIRFKDGWGLLRASNTQPSLVLRFEAPNEARLAEMRELIEGWLRQNI